MKLLFDEIDRPGLNTLKVYGELGGYESLRKALKMPAEDVLAELQASGVRGRGGAGFAMGKKAPFPAARARWTSTSSATPTSPSRGPSRTAS